MSFISSNKGFWTALGLLFLLIGLQALAISGDKPEFERPVLSMAASFQLEDDHEQAKNSQEGEKDEPTATEFPPSTSSAVPTKPVPPTAAMALDRQPVAQAQEDSQSTAPKTRQPRLANPPPKDETSAVLGPEFYKVRTGDSLWIIARRVGVSVERLKRLNRLRSHTIRPGQEIRTRPVTTILDPTDPIAKPVSAPAQTTAAAGRKIARGNSRATEKATPSAKRKVVAPLQTRKDAVTYKIRPGDTLLRISERYGIPLSDLMLENGILNSRSLRIGRVLRLKPSRTIKHKVARGETLWMIARRYGISVKKVLEENPLNKLTIRPGQTLQIPVLRTQRPRRSRPTSRYLVQAGKMRWLWPVRGRRVTDHFGMRFHPILKKRCFHCGVDIASRIGTRVVAPTPGIVTFAGWLRGYGRVVVLKHKNNFTTRYAHLSKINCRVGSFVRPGQTLGKTGTSGLSNGPHLHFEVRFNGRPYDPFPILKDVG